MKFFLLLAFAVGAFAGPVPVQLMDKDKQCPLICDEGQSLKYQTGKTYIYEYQSDTLTSISGIGEDIAGLQVISKVQIEVLGKCDMVLKLSDVRLMDISGTLTETKRTVAEATNAFRRQMETYPLKFGFQNGKVSELCPSDNEKTGVLNVKRAILSMFQMHSTDLEGDSRVVEFTQSLPILEETRKCNQTVDASGKLLSTECRGEHIFEPFKQTGRKASTSVTATLRYVQDEAGTSTSPIVSRRTTLQFERDESLLMGDSDARNALEAFCQNDDVTLATPTEFKKLVNAMTGMTFQSLSALKNDIEGGKFCKNAKAFFYDAIPMAGSSSSVRLIRTLIESNSLDTETQDTWLASLAFVTEPTLDMLEDVRALFSLPKPVGLLEGSTLVRGFCENQDCGKLQQVDDIMGALKSHINSKCQANTDVDKMKLIMTLKAIGNIGESSLILPSLETCVGSEESAADVKIAAFDAMRRLPCTAGRDKAVDIFRDVTVDSELRIAAYLALMKCPNSETLKMIKDQLLQDKPNQVGSFVWTHLTNLKDTSAATKENVKSILEDPKLVKSFSRLILKLSRNIEKTFFSEEYNLGVTGESNLIWSEKSTLPRSANLNVTADIFGKSVNFFEIGARVEGMEKILKKYILKGETKTAENEEDFKAAYFMRLFGNDIHFDEMSEEKKEKEDVLDNFMQKVFEAIRAGEDYTFSKSFTFLDTSVDIITLSGLPLKMAVSGTANTLFTVGGSFKLSFREGTIEIASQMKPSAAIQVSGTMTINALGFSECGLRSESILHTSTAQSGIFSIKNNHLNVKLSPIKKEQDIISMRSKIFIVTLGKSVEQIPAASDMDTWKSCTGSSFETVLGKQVCATLVKPSGYFCPFTAPFEASLTMVQTDDFDNYEFNMAMTDEVVRTRDDPYIRKGFRIKFDTPGSKVNRKLLLDLSYNPEEMKAAAVMDTPWKKADFTVQWQLKEYLWKYELVSKIDGEAIFGSTGTMNIRKSENVLSYYPMLEVKLLEKVYQVAGRMNVGDNKSGSFDLHLIGLTDDKLSISGALEAPEKPSGNWIVSAGIVSKPLTTKVRAEFQNGDNNAWSGKLDVSYDRENQPGQTAKIWTKVRDFSTESLTKYIFDSGFDVSFLPSAKTIAGGNFEWRKSGGEIDIKVKHGNDHSNNENRILFHKQWRTKNVRNSRFITSTIKFAYPKFDIEVIGESRLNWQMERLFHDFNLEYLPGRKVSWSVDLNMADSSVDIIVSYPGRTMKLTSAYKKIENKHSHSLTAQWQENKKITAITTVSEDNSIYVINTDVSHPFGDRFVANGKLALNPANFLISMKANKYSFEYAHKLDNSGFDLFLLATKPSHTIKFKTTGSLSDNKVVLSSSAFFSPSTKLSADFVGEYAMNAVQASVTLDGFGQTINGNLKYSKLQNKQTATLNLSYGEKYVKLSGQIQQTSNKDITAELNLESSCEMAKKISASFNYKNTEEGCTFGTGLTYMDKTYSGVLKYSINPNLQISFTLNTPLENYPVIIGNIAYDNSISITFEAGKHMFKSVGKYSSVNDAHLISLKLDSTFKYLESLEFVGGAHNGLKKLEFMAKFSSAQVYNLIIETDVSRTQFLVTLTLTTPIENFEKNSAKIEYFQSGKEISGGGELKIGRQTYTAKFEAQEYHVALLVTTPYENVSRLFVKGTYKNIGNELSSSLSVQYRKDKEISVLLSATLDDRDEFMTNGKVEINTPFAMFRRALIAWDHSNSGLTKTSTSVSLNLNDDYIRLVSGYNISTNYLALAKSFQGKLMFESSIPKLEKLVHKIDASFSLASGEIHMETQYAPGRMIRTNVQVFYSTKKGIAVKVISPFKNYRNMGLTFIVLTTNDLYSIDMKANCLKKFFDMSGKLIPTALFSTTLEMKSSWPMIEDIYFKTNLEKSGKIYTGNMRTSYNNRKTVLLTGEFGLEPVHLNIDLSLPSVRFAKNIMRFSYENRNNLMAKMSLDSQPSFGKVDIALNSDFRKSHNLEIKTPFENAKHITFTTVPHKEGIALTFATDSHTKVHMEVSMLAGKSSIVIPGIQNIDLSWSTVGEGYNGRTCDISIFYGSWESPLSVSYKSNRKDDTTVVNYEIKSPFKMLQKFDLKFTFLENMLSHTLSLDMKYQDSKFVQLLKTVDVTDLENISCKFNLKSSYEQMQDFSVSYTHKGNAKDGMKCNFLTQSNSHVLLDVTLKTVYESLRKFSLQLNVKPYNMLASVASSNDLVTIEIKALEKELKVEGEFNLPNVRVSAASNIPGYEKIEVKGKLSTNLDGAKGTLSLTFNNQVGSVEVEYNVNLGTGRVHVVTPSRDVYTFEGQVTEFNLQKLSGTLTLNTPIDGYKIIRSTYKHNINSELASVSLTMQTPKGDVEGEAKVDFVNLIGSVDISTPFEALKTFQSNLKHSYTPSTFNGRFDYSINSKTNYLEIAYDVSDIQDYTMSVTGNILPPLEMNLAVSQQRVKALIAFKESDLLNVEGFYTMKNEWKNVKFNVDMKAPMEVSLFLSKDGAWNNMRNTVSAKFGGKDYSMTNRFVFESLQNMEISFASRPSNCEFKLKNSYLRNKIESEIVLRGEGEDIASFRLMIDTYRHVSIDAKIHKYCPCQFSWSNTIQETHDVVDMLISHNNTPVIQFKHEAAVVDSIRTMSYSLSGYVDSQGTFKINTIEPFKDISVSIAAGKFIEGKALFVCNSIEDVSMTINLKEPLPFHLEISSKGNIESLESQVNMNYEGQDIIDSKLTFSESNKDLNLKITNLRDTVVDLTLAGNIKSLKDMNVVVEMKSPVALYLDATSKGDFTNYEGSMNVKYESVYLIRPELKITTGENILVTLKNGDEALVDGEVHMNYKSWNDASFNVIVNEPSRIEAKFSIKGQANGIKSVAYLETNNNKWLDTSIDITGDKRMVNLKIQNGDQVIIDGEAHATYKSWNDASLDITVKEPCQLKVKLSVEGHANGIKSVAYLENNNKKWLDTSIDVTGDKRMVNLKIQNGDQVIIDGEAHVSYKSWNDASLDLTVKEPSQLKVKLSVEELSNGIKSALYFESNNKKWLDASIDLTGNQRMLNLKIENANQALVDGKVAWVFDGVQHMSAAVDLTVPRQLSVKLSSEGNIESFKGIVAATYEETQYADVKLNLNLNSHDGLLKISNGQTTLFEASTFVDYKSLTDMRFNIEMKAPKQVKIVATSNGNINDLKSSVKVQYEGNTLVDASLSLAIENENVRATLTNLEKVILDGTASYEINSLQDMKVTVDVKEPKNIHLTFSADVTAEQSTGNIVLKYEGQTLLDNAVSLKIMDNKISFDVDSNGNNVVGATVSFNYRSLEDMSIIIDLKGSLPFYLNFNSKGNFESLESNVIMKYEGQDIIDSKLTFSGSNKDLNLKITNLGDIVIDLTFLL